MKPWSHLANADLIDWVIASVKANPEKWTATYDAIRESVCYRKLMRALPAVQIAALSGNRHGIGVKVWEEARNNLEDANYRGSVAAAETVLVLVAYDDCQQYLDMSYEQLLAWALLSERSQVLLLLYLKWMQEHLSESLAVTAVA